MVDASKTMLNRARDEAGGWIVIFALLTCLGITAALAWQAYDAGRRHRESAEQVVREYASTAAAEFLGRSKQQFDFYGVLPVLRSFLLWAGEHGGEDLPDASALQDGYGNPIQGLPLVAGLFRVSSDLIQVGHGVTHDGTHAVESGLITRLGSDPLDAREARVLTFDDGVKLVVTRDAQEGIIGFQIDPRAAAEYFTRSHAGSPLVPSLLGDGLENDEIYVELVDVTGEELFRSSGSWNATTGVETTVSDDFGGFLSGMTIRVSISPEAAHRVAGGGIPRTRLPLLLAMLAITAVLLVMATAQIRRERQLARLRSDFVSGVSHELRTPLTQIRMFSETLLLGRTRSADETRRSLEIIDHEAMRLAHLVENILQFSRAERGAIQIATSRVDLASILEETIDGFRAIAGSGGSKIELRLDSRPAADADGDALRQILLNLLDNALKYGPAGQTIVVSLTTRGGRAHIAVDDEGPGVPLERRDRSCGRRGAREPARGTCGRDRLDPRSRRALCGRAADGR
jgi:signal transduction histidine kinase